MTTLTESTLDTVLLNALDFEPDEEDDLCIVCWTEATHVMIARVACPHDGQQTPLCQPHVEFATAYLDSLYVIWCLPCQPKEVEVKREDITFKPIKGQ